MLCHTEYTFRIYDMVCTLGVIPLKYLFIATQIRSPKISVLQNLICFLNDTL